MRVPGRFYRHDRRKHVRAELPACCVDQEVPREVSALPTRHGGIRGAQDRCVGGYGDPRRWDRSLTCARNAGKQCHGKAKSNQERDVSSAHPRSVRREADAFPEGPTFSTKKNVRLTGTSSNPRDFCEDEPFFWDVYEKTPRVGDSPRAVLRGHDRHDRVVAMVRHPCQRPAISCRERAAAPLMIL